MNYSGLDQLLIIGEQPTIISSRVRHLLEEQITVAELISAANDLYRWSLAADKLFSYDRSMERANNCKSLFYAAKPPLEKFEQVNSIVANVCDEIAQRTKLPNANYLQARTLLIYCDNLRQQAEDMRRELWCHT